MATNWERIPQYATIEKHVFILPHCFRQSTSQLVSESLEHALKNPKRSFLGQGDPGKTMLKMGFFQTSNSSLQFALSVNMSCRQFQFLFRRAREINCFPRSDELDLILGSMTLKKFRARDPTQASWRETCARQRQNGHLFTF